MEEYLKTYWQNARDIIRANIPVIPGTGTVAGGFRLRGFNYVFRAGVLYRGDSYAWTEVAMPEVMYFDNGVTELFAGDEISDGTETATIASITVQGGVWDGESTDKAHGYITTSDATGEFTVSANLTKVGVAGTVAAVKTANAEYALVAGGKYKTVEYNFTNTANNSSIYGVSGVNPAFEFDGTNYIPIFNPDADNDTPSEINIHQKRLQLGYAGGVMAYSVSVMPRVFNALLGAGTYSTGSEITGIKTIHGNAAVIGCEKATWFLLGDGVYDDATATRNWQFYEHGNKVSCASNTMVGEDQVYYISDTKTRRIRATDTAANYDAEHICKQIQPYLETNRGKAISSLWAREKSQYRVFFTGGSALYMTIDEGSVRGATPCPFPIDVQNVWSAVEDGKELIFFTSSTGYLYRMDSGNSFDGDYITGSFRLPFHSYGSARVNKRFPQIILEMDAPVFLSDDTTITATVNFSYGSSSAPRTVPQTITEIEGGGGVYGNNDGYGSFVYGGAAVSEIHAYLDGYGANMSILINFRTRNDNPFTFVSAIVDYREIGIKRQQ